MLAASPEDLFPVLCAETQTGGRGRRGNAFYSPAGGAYFSAAFPLSEEDRNFPFLTLLAGLCTAKTLETLCGAEARIKWPNDLYLSDRKLSGILTELILVNGKKTAVVGIGVNLTSDPADFPPALAHSVTSLAAAGYRAPSPETLAHTIVQALDMEIYEKGALRAVYPRYAAQINKRSYLNDKSVTVVSGETRISGTVLYVEPDGGLRLRTAQGEQCVYYGSVEY